MPQAPYTYIGEIVHFYASDDRRLDSVMPAIVTFDYKSPYGNVDLCLLPRLGSPSNLTNIPMSVEPRSGHWTPIPFPSSDAREVPAGALPEEKPAAPTTEAVGYLPDEET